MLTLDTAFSRTLEKHPELARFNHLREVARATARRRGPGPADAPGVRARKRSPVGSGLLIRYRRSDAESRVGLRARRQARCASRGRRRAVQRARCCRKSSAVPICSPRSRDVIWISWRRSRWRTWRPAEVAQREEVVEATAKRVRAGATPESVRLAAEAALARATLQRDRLRAQTRAAALQTRDPLEQSRAGFRSWCGRSAVGSRDSNARVVARAHRPQSRVAPIRG